MLRVVGGDSSGARCHLGMIVEGRTVHGLHDWGGGVLRWRVVNVHELFRQPYEVGALLSGRGRTTYSTREGATGNVCQSEWLGGTHADPQKNVPESPEL